MKIHDLKPAAGSDQAPQARRSRHRRQGRQDRRPRHQGPEGPRHRPRRLRRRPAAAAHAGPEAEGLQQPVPRRVPGASTSTCSRPAGLDEVDPETLHAHGPHPQGRPGQGARPRRDHPRRARARPTRFSKSAEAAITAAGGTRRGPAAAVGRPSSAGQGQPAHQPLTVATSDPVADQEPSGACQPEELFKVPDLRNKVLFTLLMIVLYRLGAHLPVPGIDVSALKQLQGAGRAGRRARLPAAVLRRRAHPVRHLRPRDHAVHHGVDHHADPRRGDPQARGVAEPGRGRPAQDHAVDPLPHHRHRHRAGHRPHLPVPQRRRRASAAATPPASTWCPTSTSATCCSSCSPSPPAPRC